VTRALLGDATVLASHVVQQGDEVVAYVVTSGTAPLARISKALGSLAPRLVQVSHIPLDGEGRVDEGALLRLPVVDDALAQKWEAALRSTAGVERARVFLRDEEVERGRLHLDQLVPGWRRRRTVDGSRTNESAAALELDGSGLPSSYCCGPALEVPAGAPETLVEALLRVAERWGDERGLTVYESATDRVFISYRTLVTRATRIAAGLRLHGVERGDPVLLQMDRLSDHFAGFWGAVLAGAAPVGVARAPSYEESNAVLSKLWNTWTLLGEPALLASESLCAPLRRAERLYGASFEPLSLERLEAAASAGDTAFDACPEDVVFIQLTSGSTGVPKCVPETHRAVIAHVLGASQMSAYTEHDVGLNWLSLDHVVPLLTCHLRDTYLGLQQIHVRTQAVLVDPLLWLDLIEAHRVTLSWAPNFGFKLVNDALARAGGRSWDLSSLRRVMNAGEQVTLPVSAAWVRNLAPFGVRADVMQPAYGMAEVATAVTYANDFAPERAAHVVRKASLGGVLDLVETGGPDTITFVDVGPPIPGVELRITSGAGGVLPECVIGRIQVRGRVTLPCYLENAEATAETLLADGWFDTGDLGFVRDGRLTVTGRSKEMIIVRGANFYCYEVEDVVNDTPGVLSTFSAVCAMDDPATGSEGLAVFFVPEKRTTRPDPALIASVQERITREFGVAPTCVLPLTREAFPKTTSGKIQRTQLRKALARGDFDDLLREVDLALDSNTLPAWFLEWGWRKARAEDAPWKPSGATLIVQGAGCTAKRTADALVAALGDTPVFRIESAATFSDDDARNLAGVLDDRGDLARAFQTLFARGFDVHDVFALDLTPGALLSLAQTLAALHEVRLTVGVEGALRVHACDVPMPERAALRPLVETVSVEWPIVDTRLVDVSGHPNAAAALMHEAGVVAKERVVAYREGERLVPRLRPAEFGDARAALEPGQLVVVSGGLGGIGGALCAHLLAHHGVRLLITGRSDLKDESDAPHHEGLGRRKDASERRDTLRELESLGEVMYRQVDVTDRAAMADAVAEAEHRFGTRLRAAIHLAGVFPPRLLAEETPATLAATIAPKLDGARCLAALLPEDDLLVLFGSVYGIFGAAACGGYGAANAALEAVAATRSGPTRVIAWSNWNDLGMSRGYAAADSSRALGFEMIGRREGLDAFDAALCARGRSLLIGLDTRRPNVRRHVEGAPQSLRRLVALHTPAKDAAALTALTVPDAFGRPTRCALQEVQLDGAGELDASVLDRALRSHAADAVLPRTAAERAVAAIWQEVLEIDRVDIDANFFSLGGQSLLLLRVQAKLEQSFGREVAVVDLFRYPTVRSLSAFLSESVTKKRTFDDAAERARRQRAVVRTRGRPGGRA
jgi:acyl-CoA synthetase (AMP-forming)/AMP-acid ligase II/NAD(P)-dependent dehydrogenase (short-subunit alcohol dehydrogenase family)/acyl carrier protein